MAVHFSWLHGQDGQAGKSPESFARIEEIHEDELEEHKTMEGALGEDEKDDESDDSGFEASSQSSFCPEKFPAPKD